MMRRIVESSLRMRHLIVAIAAVMMVFGVKELRDAPVDVLPEFEPPIVEVQTEALGLSAAEVEALITMNLEELLSGVSWLKSLRSQSVPGLSSILMVFEPGTDVMRARQLVQERLTLAYTLPNVSKVPAMLQPLSAASRFMIVGLSSKTVSPIQLSVLTRWTIKPRLMGVRGVANVAVWGDRDRQLQVQLNPQRLADNRVTQEQLIRTAGDALWVSPLTFLNASFPGAGGWIDTPNQRLGIQHFLPISGPEDMAKVPVEGAAMRLGEVATVVEGHPPLIGDAILNGGDGVILVLEKFPGTNTLQVTRDVEKALAALRAGLPGVEIDNQIFRAASYIEASFGNLDKAWAIGGLLLLMVLVAALFHIRVAVISLVAVPVALMTAALVLYFSGATINLMVLAGLVVALGVIIADAVVDVENIVRRLQRPGPGDADKSTARIVAEASLETRGPMLYAMLITLLTVLPILVMQGLSGAFFLPLAFSYAVAIASSMVVALIVTPALAVLLLRVGFAEGQESVVSNWVRARYDRIFARSVEAPKFAFVAAGAVAIIGLASWNWIGQSLVPSFKERHVLIDWAGAPGASQPAMTRIMNRATRELRALPGVRDVGAHVGRAVTGDQIVGINSAQLWVSMDDNADYDRTLASIREVAAGYPGFSGNVKTYLTERVREVLTGTDRPLVVRLFGPRRDVLAQQADQMKGLLSNIPGITDLQVEGQVEEPQVEVKVDLAKAEPYGLKPGDIRRQTATVFAGLGVGNLFEEQKVFDVVVWGTPETRQSLDNVRNLLLETPRGRAVRLGEIAEIKLVPSPTVIQRERISPRVDIVANVRDRDLRSVADLVEDRLEGFKFPLEYHAEVVGENVAREAAEARLVAVVIAAALGILLLLQAAFRSWRVAFAFFLTLPTAVAGGLLGAWLDGGVLTLGSFLGVLAVVGIAARDGILLIKRYQRLEEREGVPFGPALVHRGTREQILPIVLAAAATAAVLIPLVALGDIAGLEIVHPMAVVMLAGLITSTLVSLTVVPALYLRFGGKREPELELSPAA